MSRLPLDNLPDDPDALKAIVAALQDQRDDILRRHDETQRRIQSLEVKERQLEARTQALEVEKLRLEMELLRFKKWYYGPRADDLQHHTDAAQLLLAFATDLESRPLEPQDLSPQSDPAGTDPKTVRRVRKGRRDLAAFDNLPVIRHVHDLSEDQKPCPCCGEVRQKIGHVNRLKLIKRKMYGRAKLDLLRIRVLGTRRVCTRQLQA